MHKSVYETISSNNASCINMWFILCSIIQCGDIWTYREQYSFTCWHAFHVKWYGSILRYMVYVVQYHFICKLIVWCAVLFPMMTYGTNYRVCFSRIIKNFFSNWKKNSLFYRFNRFTKSNHESRLLQNQLWQDLSPKIYLMKRDLKIVGVTIMKKAKKDL